MFNITPDGRALLKLMERHPNMVAKPVEESPNENSSLVFFPQTTTHFVPHFKSGHVSMTEASNKSIFDINLDKIYHELNMIKAHDGSRYEFIKDIIANGSNDEQNIINTYMHVVLDAMVYQIDLQVCDMLIAVLFEHMSAEFNFVFDPEDKSNYELIRSIITQGITVNTKFQLLNYLHSGNYDYLNERLKIIKLETVNDVSAFLYKVLRPLPYMAFDMYNRTASDNNNSDIANTNEVVAMEQYVQDKITTSMIEFNAGLDFILSQLTIYTVSGIRNIILDMFPDFFESCLRIYD